MNDPAWQSLTPDLVPPSKLAAAVALNSAGFNIARAVGPALGGLVIAAIGSGTSGSGWAFLLNAVSFFGVILFLYVWKPAKTEHSNGATTFSGAIAVGLRYARQEPRIRIVLVRTLVFSIFASAFWALLPLIASKFGDGYESWRVGTWEPEPVRRVAVERSGVNMRAPVFTTDGQLQGNKYTQLSDPKNVFGYQNVAPVISKKVLSAEGPAFTQTLNAVSALLSTEAMRRMNAAVVLDKQDPAAVASAFLKANNVK